MKTSRTCSMFPVLTLHFLFPFHVFDGSGVSAFFWGDLVVSLSLSFYCRGFSACLSVLTKRGVLQSTSAAFYWMGWAQEKSAIGLKEYGEWNRDEVHPTFFDDEDISTQERISMDEGG